MSLSISPVQISDTAYIAQLHKLLFTDHLLGQMPVSLIQKFYNCILSYPNIFLCAKQNNELVGFIMGGNADHINTCRKQFIKQYGLTFLWNTLINKNARRLFLKKYLTPKGELIYENKENESIQISLWLTSIGINPNFQRHGYAQMLVSAFETELKHNHQNHLPLCYGLGVQPDNFNAIKFYEKNGFTKKYQRHTISIFYKII